MHRETAVRLPSRHQTERRDPILPLAEALRPLWGEEPPSVRADRV